MFVLNLLFTVSKSKTKCFREDKFTVVCTYSFSIVELLNSKSHSNATYVDKENIHNEAKSVFGYL